VTRRFTEFRQRALLRMRSNCSVTPDNSGKIRRRRRLGRTCGAGSFDPYGRDRMRASSSLRDARSKFPASPVVFFLPVAGRSARIPMLRGGNTLEEGDRQGFSSCRTRCLRNGAYNRLKRLKWHRRSTIPTRAICKPTRRQWTPALAARTSPRSLRSRPSRGNAIG